MQDSRRVVVRDLRFGRACCTPWENCDGCQCSAPPCQSADSPRATRASQKAGWRCHLSHPDNNVFLCVTTHRFSSKERQARVANWETRRSLESVVCSPNRPRGWLAGCHHITLDTRCCVLCSVFCTAVLRILHAVFCTHVRERAGKHPPAPWESGCLGRVATGRHGAIAKMATWKEPRNGALEAACVSRAGHQTDRTGAVAMPSPAPPEEGSLCTTHSTSSRGTPWHPNPGDLPTPARLHRLLGSLGRLGRREPAVPCGALSGPWRSKQAFAHPAYQTLSPNH